MSLNIRNRIATGFGDLVAEHFFFPVVLYDPEGVEYKTNASTGGVLKGEVLYDKETIEPETGDLNIINDIRVSIFKDHLVRVPLAGEIWKIKFSLNPASQNILSTFSLPIGKAPIDGASIGYIKLFPGELDQL